MFDGSVSVCECESLLLPVVVVDGCFVSSLYERPCAYKLHQDACAVRRCVLMLTSRERFAAATHANSVT
jgi:hypothetical protein